MPSGLVGLEQVAVGVVLIARRVAFLVDEGQRLGERVVGERDRVAQRVGLAGHVAVGVVRVGRGRAVGRDDLDQVVVGIVSVARDVAQGVDRLAEVALVVVEGGRRVAVGVGDRVFAGAG